MGLRTEKQKLSDEAILAEVEKLDAQTAQLIAWLEMHPADENDVRRFTTYYLPTTLKLLRTYNEVGDKSGESRAAAQIEDVYKRQDTCLTAGDPVWNMSGTLFEGIECWAKRKDKLTKADVRDRVQRAVRMQAANGIQHVRTHVDVTDPKLTAMEAMLELKQELKDVMDIQIVAFPQEGILSLSLIHI